MRNPHGNTLTTDSPPSKSEWERLMSRHTALTSDPHLSTHHQHQHSPLLSSDRGNFVATITPPPCWIDFFFFSKPNITYYDPPYNPLVSNTSYYILKSIYLALPFQSDIPVDNTQILKKKTFHWWKHVVIQCLSYYCGSIDNDLVYHTAPIILCIMSNPYLVFNFFVYHICKTFPIQLCTHGRDGRATSTLGIVICLLSCGQSSSPHIWSCVNNPILLSPRKAKWVLEKIKMDINIEYFNHWLA